MVTEATGEHAPAAKREILDLPVKKLRGVRRRQKAVTDLQRCV